MEMNIRRINLEEGSEAFVSFTSRSKTWLVKNFGSGDVYVSFVSPVDTERSIKIPTGSGQYCEIDARGGSFGAVNTVYLVGSGEVEVQQL